MDVAQVLIDGKWRAADAEGTFQAENPATGEALPLSFPTSRWSDCDLALNAATKAAAQLRTMEPAKIAAFLEAYAANIEANAAAIVAAAAKRPLFPPLRASKMSSSLALPISFVRRQLRSAKSHGAKPHSILKKISAPASPRSARSLSLAPIIFPSHSMGLAEVTSPPPSPQAILSSQKLIPFTPIPLGSSPNRPSKLSSRSVFLSPPYR